MSKVGKHKKEKKQKGANCRVEQLRFNQARKAVLNNEAARGFSLFFLNVGGKGGE
jgi:pyruvate/2-oxoglutarate dehydrogenase complex dihydrolipoamide dehydrogenase (E3) component